MELAVAPYRLGSWSDFTPASTSKLARNLRVEQWHHAIGFLMKEQRRDDMASILIFLARTWQLGKLAAVVVVVLCGLTLGTALAGPASSPGAVEKAIPQGQDPPGADELDQTAPSDSQGENLSEQLDRNKGVITPPATGDSEIYTEAPNPNPGTTPVIPPPGTPGGDQSIVPK